MHPSIKCLLFDLDCTLYSVHLGLEKNVSVRVTDFVAAFLGLPKEEAAAVRRAGVREGRYGTTMEWLRKKKGMNDADTDRYLAFVHPADEAEALAPDPRLRSFLLSLPFPLGILTNSPMEHAHRILDKLGVLDLFPTIFDIRWNGLEGKPNVNFYLRALAEMGAEPASGLFIDDSLFYIEGYMEIGGTGVYFDEENHHPEFSGFRIGKLEEIYGLKWPDNTPVLQKF